MTQDQVDQLVAAIETTTMRVAELEAIATQTYVAALATAVAAGLTAGLVAAQIVTRSLTLKRWWT